MTDVGSADHHDLEHDDDSRVARRRFLRRGAITAAVAASGAAVLAGPAGAAENDTVLIGSTNDGHNTGTTTTTLTGSQLRALNGNDSISLVGEQTGNNAVAIEGRSSVGAQLRLAPNTLDLTDPDDVHAFAAGSLVTDTNDILWYAFEDGAGVDTGLHPISLTSALLPFETPQRAIDTRSSGGPIDGNIGQQRVIHIFNINAAATIVAMSCNLTVVDTTGSGFLALWAGTPVWDPANPFSSINWFTNGQITANCVISGIDNAAGNVTVRAGGPGTTNFIIDVTAIWVI